MKACIIICCILSVPSLAGLKAQADTGIESQSRTLKKGLYRNYTDFINNEPSYTDEFIVTPVYLNKKDTTNIIAGVYHLADSTKTLDHVWGFCDGHTVFINSSPSLTIHYYWKLISLGKYPFFKGASNSKGIPGLNIGSSLRFLATQTIHFKPRNLLIQIITEKGRFKEPDISYMKKLLAPRPELLKAFVAEAGPYEKFDNPNVDIFESDEDYENKLTIIAHYLIKLNDAIKN